MTRVSIIIPFRDRGLDPRRNANLDVVQAWWYAHGFDPVITSDGGRDDQQFNRHKAYNRAVAAHPNTDVFIFAEADMLVPFPQVTSAVSMAAQGHGLVVPFTQYRYLSDFTTARLRDDFADMSPREQAALILSGSVFSIPPESTMEDGRSIGAVNIVSRETLILTGGFTEMTSGNWYDDRIIEEGFAFLTASPTRFVPGPAVHLYHLPGWTGDHLSEADKRATARNRDLLVRLRTDIRMGKRRDVKRLMQYREGK